VSNIRIIVSEIKLLAAGVPAGQTKAGETCPFCLGGNSGEKTFSVTKKESGEILYKCHRGKCGSAGRVAGFISDDTPQEKKPPRVFRGNTQFLSDEQMKFFHTKFNLTAREIGRGGLQWCPELQQIVHPVFSPQSINNVRGVVLRDYRNKSIDGYREKEHEPWQAWYLRDPELLGERKGLVIVEDQLSALKASRFWNGVALLNMTITVDKVLEIKNFCERNSVKKIALVLDSDAQSQAIAFAQRWQGILEGLRVHFSTNNKDLKYWQENEILSIFE
jgi:hypothetical protein